MKINKLLIKNFKGFGPEETVLEFNDASELSMIIGGNGAGKSSISHAILYVLYGKNPEGGTIQDLCNRIHPTEMLVEIEIESNNSVVNIRRTPKSFDVNINGNEWEQAGKSKMQEILEAEYIKLPYYAFKNILIVSIDDFSSYLTMSPGDKRKIFDKIFGFSIINDMRKLNRNVLSDMEQEVKDYGIKIDQLTKNIEDSRSHIESYVKSLNEQRTAEEEELKSNIESCKTKIEEITEKYKKVKEHESKLKDKHESFNNALYKNKNELSNNKKKLDLFNKHHKCPTCESSLDTEFHNNIKEELLEKEKELTKIYEDISSKLETLKSKKANIGPKINKLNDELSKYKNEMYFYSEKLKSLEKAKDGSTESNISNLEELVSKFENDLKTAKDEKYKVSKKEKFYHIADNLLSEEGVKKVALNAIIPKLNSYIEKESENMHLKYDVKFTENFDVNIFHFGNEISAKTLSTGEKKKFDFVILMSILKMIKTKYQSFNILFLDEIFSSVDADGRHSILKILKEFVEDYKMKAFVINHSELPLQPFNRCIHLKNDQFSTISIDDL